MKIKTKLYLNILVSATLIVFFLLTRIILFNDIDKESQRVKLAAEVKTAVFDLNVLLNDYLSNRLERAAEQWELRYNSGFTVLQKAEEEEEEEEEERVLIKTLANDYLLFSRSFRQAVENYNYKQKLIKDGAPPQELVLLEEQDARIIARLSIQSQSVISSANILEQRALARLDKIYALTRNSAYGLAILILIITTAVSIKISRGIARSLYKLHRGTEIIGAGNLEHKIDIKTKDEIGQVATAFNEMVKKLRQSYESLEGKVKERTEQLDEKINTLEDNKKAMINLLEDLETTKKQADTLAQDLYKFKLAMDNTSDSIVITDPDGIVIYGNMAIEKTTGYKPEEALGKKAGVLWKSPMPPEYYKKMWETIKKQKKTFTSEIQNKRKNGEIYTAVINISPIVNKKGETEFFVAIERDITREKEVDRMKSEFISLASHQLRTPLTATKWFGEMLLSGDAGKLKGEQKEYIQNIYKSNERMIALVNSLLNISRIESGRLIVEPHPTDLANLVNEVVNELGVKTKEKKLSVIVSIHPQLPKINIDPKLVRNIYMNLLTNAIKYTPEKGEISVFISKRGNKIISQVSDTGVGIPQKEQSRIFSKFFRGENIIKLQTDGTGLGLYLVKSIVESSNGKIWFESTEGKGTTFRFSLPLTGVTSKKGEVTLER